MTGIWPGNKQTHETQPARKPRALTYFSYRQCGNGPCCQRHPVPEQFLKLKFNLSKEKTHAVHGLKGKVILGNGSVTEGSPGHPQGPEFAPQHLGEKLNMTSYTCHPSAGEEEAG